MDRVYSFFGLYQETLREVPLAKIPRLSLRHYLFTNPKIHHETITIQHQKPGYIRKIGYRETKLTRDEYVVQFVHAEGPYFLDNNEQQQAAAFATLQECETFFETVLSRMLNAGYVLVHASLPSVSQLLQDMQQEGEPIITTPNELVGRYVEIDVEIHDYYGVEDEKTNMPQIYMGRVEDIEMPEAMLQNVSGDPWDYRINTNLRLNNETDSWLLLSTCERKLVLDTPKHRTVFCSYMHVNPLELECEDHEKLLEFESVKVRRRFRVTDLRFIRVVDIHSIQQALRARLQSLQAKEKQQAQQQFGIYQPPPFPAAPHDHDDDYTRIWRRRYCRKKTVVGGEYIYPGFIRELTFAPSMLLQRGSASSVPSAVVWFWKWILEESATEWKEEEKKCDGSMTTSGNARAMRESDVPVMDGAFIRVRGDSVLFVGDGNEDRERLFTFPVLVCDALRVSNDCRLSLIEGLLRLGKALNDVHENEPLQDLIDPNLFPRKLRFASDGKRFEKEVRDARNSAKRIRNLFHWVPVEFFISQDRQCVEIRSDLHPLCPRTPDTEQLYLDIAETFRAVLPGLAQLNVIPPGCESRPLVNALVVASVYLLPHGCLNTVRCLPEDVAKKILTYLPVNWDFEAKALSLQVVVKAQSYQMLPGASYNGKWHVEGLTERIVAIATYYPRVDEGIEGGNLRFRQLNVLAHSTHGCNFETEVAVRQGSCVVFANNNPHRVRRISVAKEHVIINSSSNIHEKGRKESKEEEKEPFLRRLMLNFFIVDPQQPLPTTQANANVNQEWPNGLSEAKAFRHVVRRVMGNQRTGWGYTGYGNCGIYAAPFVMVDQDRIGPEQANPEHDHAVFARAPLCDGVTMQRVERYQHGLDVHLTDSDGMRVFAARLP